LYCVRGDVRYLLKAQLKQVVCAGEGGADRPEVSLEENRPPIKKIGGNAKKNYFEIV